MLSTRRAKIIIAVLTVTITWVVTNVIGRGLAYLLDESRFPSDSSIYMYVLHADVGVRTLVFSINTFLIAIFCGWKWIKNINAASSRGQHPQVPDSGELPRV
jgi:CBS domain containing-hemolysin-like protein